ncbi:MAG: dCTP deaminase [Terriglobales bacterium]
MILSNEGIKLALQTGDIGITPVPRPEQYTTSAVDLVLGDDFRIWDEERLSVPGARIDLNLAEQQFNRTARAYLREMPKERDGSVVFPPYSRHPWHILGQTRERVSLNAAARLAARVEGRSSFARLGLVVHLTAPTIHAGFEGNITLEMINFGPFHLRLVPGDTRICQLILERLETDPTQEIATDFQGQMTPAGERTPAL